MNVLRHLYTGADQPTTYPVLAERMGLTEREAQAAVEAARKAGVPVISGGRGLWLASSPQEAREWVERQRARAIHMMETAQAVERWADVAELSGQPTLWEDAA